MRAPDLCAFLADETTRRPAPSSQARAIAALKGFFRFCVENEYPDRDPAAVLRAPKKRGALPDVLDRHERGRLLAMPEHGKVWEREHAAKRERDRLLVALFAYRGLRRAELPGLGWTTLTWARGSCACATPRAGASVSSPSIPNLVPLFDDYLARRLALGIERAL